MITLEVDGGFRDFLCDVYLLFFYTRRKKIIVEVQGNSESCKKIRRGFRYRLWLVFSLECPSRDRDLTAVIEYQPTSGKVQE